MDRLAQEADLTFEVNVKELKKSSREYGSRLKICDASVSGPKPAANWSPARMLLSFIVYRMKEGALCLM